MATDLKELESNFPDKLSGRFFPLTADDGFFLLAAFALLILLGHEIGKKGWVIVIILAVLLMLPSDYGRFYKMIWRRLTSGLRNKRIWEAGRKDIPIPIDIHGIDQLGILHSTANNEDSIIIAGEGSDITSREIDGQYDAILDLAEVIRKIAALGENRGYNVGFGWIFRTRSLNMHDLWARLESYLNANTLQPPEKPEDQWSEDDHMFAAYGENIQQVLDVTDEFGRQVTMAATCTIRREGLDKDLTDETFRRLPVNQMASLLRAEMEGAGVIDAQVLPPRELHEFLRGTWDIRHIEEYQEWLTTSDDKTVLESNRHRPQKGIYDMGGGTLQIDDSYHAVLWLKKFPQKMYPDHLRRLFQIDVPYLSVALIGKTRPYGTEYGILDRYLSLRGDVESKVGVVHKGPRWEDRERRIAERQQMLYRSRYSMDYNILVALHHIDRQGLEEAVDTALQEISLGNMRADRVTDTEWLLPFLLAATTGIDIGML